MNPIFNALGGMPMTGNTNIMGIVNQFKANPIGMLRQRFNIPANLNDPNSIIQHLMNSGQLSQSQFEQARQMAQQLGIK